MIKGHRRSFPSNLRSSHTIGEDFVLIKPFQEHKPFKNFLRTCHKGKTNMKMQFEHTNVYLEGLVCRDFIVILLRHKEQLHPKSEETGERAQLLLKRPGFSVQHPH